MSERLGPEFDLPPHQAVRLPSGSAYQCPDCGGIAYNPVCPYCHDDDDDSGPEASRADS